MEAPPPPPPKPLALPDAFTLEALRSLGYRVEDVSPWQLVSDLLQNSTQLTMQHQREREELLLKLDEQTSLVEQSQQDNLNLLAEIAGKLASQNANEDVHKLRNELAASKLECTRLASIVSFAASTQQENEQPTQNTTAAAEQVKLNHELLNENSMLREQVSKLEEQVEQLRADFESRDFNMQRLNDQVKQANEAKQVVDALLAESREETKLASQLLLDEKQRARTCEAKRDQLEQALERERGEVLLLQSKLAECTNSQAVLDSQLSVVKLHLAKETEQNQHLQAQQSKFQSELATMEQVLESERKLHSLRLTEVRHASLDVENMSKENRELAHNNDALAQALRNSKAELDQIRTQYARLVGVMDASKVEREELVSVYQRACKEVDEHKQLAKDLTLQLTKSQQREKLMRQTEAQRESEIAALETKVRQQRVDMDNLERMRETLTRELRFAKTQLEEATDNKTIAERMQGADSNKLFSALRTADTMRRELETTKMELSSAKERLKRLEEENQSLSESVLAERLRNSELNDTVSRSRVHQARALTQQQHNTSSSTQSSFSTVRPTFQDFDSRVLGEVSFSSSSSSSTRDEDLLSEAGSAIRQARLGRSSSSRFRY